MNKIIDFFRKLFRISPKLPQKAGAVVAVWDCIDTDGQEYFDPYCYITLTMPAMPKYGKTMKLFFKYGLGGEYIEGGNIVEPNQKIYLEKDAQPVYWRVKVYNKFGATDGDVQPNSEQPQT